MLFALWLLAKMIQGSLREQHAAGCDARRRCNQLSRKTKASLTNYCKMLRDRYSPATAADRGRLAASKDNDSPTVSALMMARLLLSRHNSAMGVIAGPFIPQQRLVVGGGCYLYVCMYVMYIEREPTR
jgi:phage FluMu protein gp41